MNMKAVQTQLKVAQHYAGLFLDSDSVNPYAAKKLVAALSALEKAIFPASENKKPASQDGNPRRVSQ